MRKFLIFVEVVAIATTVLLAIMWIIKPLCNWEPWIVLSGATSLMAEIFRRISSAPDAKTSIPASQTPSQIRQLHSQKYTTQDCSILEATNIALESFGIKSDAVRTTGGSTGVRVWVSESHPLNRLASLHDEIVALHGNPVALDVLDYISEQVIYRNSRPPMVQQKNDEEGSRDSAGEAQDRPVCPCTEKGEKMLLKRRGFTGKFMYVCLGCGRKMTADVPDHLF